MHDHHAKSLYFMNRSKPLVVTLGVLSLLTACATAQPESGFTSLFDGQTTQGWVFVGSGPGCAAKDGILDFPKESAGDLFTDKEYSDFVLRLDYKVGARRQQRGWYPLPARQAG